MKRPKIITLICILGYLITVFSFPQIFSPGVKKLGLFMPAVYGILVSAYFISCVGIWHLKQWGVQLFVLSFFAKTIFFILTEQTSGSFYFGILISVISIIFLLRNFTKMSANL